MPLFVQVHQDTEPDAQSTLRFDEYRSCADSKLSVTLLGQAMTDDKRCASTRQQDKEEETDWAVFTRMAVWAVAHIDG